MSKVTKIGDTLPKTTPTTTSKPDFAKDVAKVQFTLPVILDNSPVSIYFLNRDLTPVADYEFDYIPNVDVNQYIQFSVHLFNNGTSSNTSKSCM